MTEAQHSDPPNTVPGQVDRRPEHVIGPFECFGRGFIIRTPDADLAGFLDELYSPVRSRRASHDVVTFTLEPPNADALGRLFSDRGLTRRSPRHGHLLRTLVWAINRHVIDEPSEDRLILHAAAAARDGRGVLLPARTRSGKTTLVAALLDRGFAYLTDEAASVDADLMIEGFPKPLSVERGSFEALAHYEPRTSGPVSRYLQSHWEVPVESFAAVVRRSRLSMIVFPRYGPSETLRFEPLEPAATVANVFTNIFLTAGRIAPHGMVTEVARIAEQIPAFAVTYSDLGAACQAISIELDRRAPDGS